VDGAPDQEFRLAVVRRSGQMKLDDETVQRKEWSGLAAARSCA